MQTTLKNLFLSSLLLILLSCSSSESRLLTYQSKLRILERRDHQKCVATGMDSGDWDEATTETYWRCRHNLVVDRKIYDEINAGTIKDGSVLEKISEEMLKNLNKAKYSTFLKINDDTKLTDHEECFSKGYNLSVGKNNDDYYACRTDLVLRRIPPAPKVTHSFEASVLPNNKINNFTKAILKNTEENNKEATLAIEKMQKYPNCIGLFVESVDFEKCSSASDRSLQCVESIYMTLSKKDLEDKIFCQEQAFIQFPDDYALAKDKSANEIEKLKSQIRAQKDGSAKKDSNMTLAYLEGERSIMKVGGTEGDNDGEQEARSKSYSRVELMNLREYFINQCIKKKESGIPEYIEAQKQICLKVANDWDVQE